MTTMTALSILAQRAEWDRHMMDGWGWGWVWMWGAGLLVLVALAAVVGTVVWSATRHDRARQPDATTRARAILSERYARGEISTEEYQERMDALR